MFKKIMTAILAVTLISQPAMAGRFGGGGGFSRSSSFSSGSSYRSSSFSTGSSYSSSYRSTGTPSYVSTNRFSTGSSYAYKPTQTRVVSRPLYSSSYHDYVGTGGVHYHYYGGFGGYNGFGGGTFSSPWFWMWMMDRNQGANQAPVYVNGGGQVAQGMPAGNAMMAQAQPQDQGSLMTYILMVVFQIIVLIVMLMLAFWGIRKLFRIIRS